MPSRSAPNLTVHLEVGLEILSICPVNSLGFFVCGGDNPSDGDRIGINITYTLGWLRQEENQYLTCLPEIAKELDQPLQE